MKDMIDSGLDTWGGEDENNMRRDMNPQIVAAYLEITNSFVS